MKNTLMTILVILFCTSILSARKSIGVKVGMNVSNVTFSGDTAKTYARLGMHAGIYNQIRISRYLILQSELLHSQKGYKDNESISQFMESKTEIDYLELPILLKYDAVTGDFRIQPFIESSLGYAIRARNIAGGESEDIMENIAKTDWGLGLGMDFTYRSRFLGGIRYVKGLSDIGLGDDKPTNTCWMLSLGYVFE